MQEIHTRHTMKADTLEKKKLQKSRKELKNKTGKRSKGMNSSLRQYEE